MSINSGERYGHRRTRLLRFAAALSDPSFSFLLGQKLDTDLSVFVAFSIEKMISFIEILSFSIEILVFFIKILAFSIEILSFSIEILSFSIEIMSFSIEILPFLIKKLAFSIVLRLVLRLPYRLNLYFSGLY